MLASGSSRPVTDLLVKWKDGDQTALQDLLPLIYDELRRVAHRYLRAERPGHTLQSTALVHEAYLRLAVQKPRQLRNRGHFFAVAAQLMRQILVDHARERKAQKRNYDHKIAFDESMEMPQRKDFDLLSLDDALRQLSQLDAQQARIVEMRFFGGLSIQETSQALSISPATVKRDWVTARAWLQREMNRAV
jgi:RNA polymerase sigma factor (TIGR02999 family)